MCGKRTIPFIIKAWLSGALSDTLRRVDRLTGFSSSPVNRYKRRTKILLTDLLLFHPVRFHGATVN
jgi:hypothetical protein